MSKMFTGIGNQSFDGENVKIEGVSFFYGGEFNDVDISGMINVNGEIKANSVKIGGVVNTNEKIEAVQLEVSGAVNLSGELRVKKANITGAVNLSSRKFEAEEINCEGVISSKAEICADVINSDGCINAKEIYGDNITIYSRKLVNKVYSKINSLFNSSNKKYSSQIGIIEATNIVLEGVRAKKVCGHNITIGKDCYIENLDCDGVLRVDSESTILNMTGDFTKENVERRAQYVKTDNTDNTDDTDNIDNENKKVSLEKEPNDKK